MSADTFLMKGQMKKKWPKNKQEIVNKIKAAKKPEDLFTKNTTWQITAGQLKDQYLEMVKLVHPDANPDIAESGEVMALLNTLHDQGQKKLEDGMWGKSKISIIFDKNKVITDVEPFKKGDLCDIYRGLLDGKTVVVKVATSAADLIKAEAEILRKMYASKDISIFGKYLPKLISDVTPFYENAPPNEQAVYRRIESYTEIPVLIKSFGPTAKEKISIL